jgi:hypothetical protein
MKKEKGLGLWDPLKSGYVHLYDPPPPKKKLRWAGITYIVLPNKMTIRNSRLQRTGSIICNRKMRCLQASMGQAELCTVMVPLPNRV